MNDYKKELEDLVTIVANEGASDLHISSGSHPTVRVSGTLIPLLKKPILSDADMLGLITALLSPSNKELFLKQREIDFSYALGDKVRFRGNGYFQQGGIVLHSD
jgi:twitching motility protein PilT